jgi:hypothetical protein
MICRLAIDRSGQCAGRITAATEYRIRAIDAGDYHCQTASDDARSMVVVAMCQPAPILEKSIVTLTSRLMSVPDDRYLLGLITGSLPVGNNYTPITPLNETT